MQGVRSSRVIEQTVQHAERYKPKVWPDIVFYDLRDVRRRRLVGVVEHRPQTVCFRELHLLQSADVKGLELIWRHKRELNFKLLTEHLKLKLLLNPKQVLFGGVYSDNEHHISYSGKFFHCFARWLPFGVE